MSRLLRFAGGGVIIGAMALAFFLSGSPSENRTLRLDEARVSDINALRRQLTQYHRSEKAMPESIAALLDWCERTSQQCYGIRDVTADAYELKVVGERDYTLCTTFERPAPNAETNDRRGAVYAHDAGYQCFDYKLPKTRSSSLGN